MKYLLIILLFISCSASKKVVTENKNDKHNDSAVVIKESATHIVDSGFKKKEHTQESQAINLEYEPAMTDKNDYVEIKLNGNIVKVPTKGLKKLNTYQKSKEEKIDSASIGILDHSEIKDSVITHTKEAVSNKSNKENKGWIADLFGGAVSKIVYIVSGVIILCIVIFIIVLIVKHRRKVKLRSVK